MISLHSDPPITDFDYSEEFEESPKRTSDLYDAVRVGNYNKFYCRAAGCDKIFFFRSAIERHVSSHMEIKPYRCTFPYCEKAFKREDSLENHIRGQHTREARLTCAFPGCKETFTTNAKLRYHNLLHSGQRPYKCSIPKCGKTFVTSSQLRQHERSFIAHKKIMGKVEEDNSEDNEKLLDGFVYDEEMTTFEETSVKKLKLESSQMSSPYDKTFDEPSVDMKLTFKESFLVGDEARRQNPIGGDEHRRHEEPEVLDTEALLARVLNENNSLKSKIEKAGSLLEMISTQYNQLEATLAKGIQQRKVVQAAPTHSRFEDNFVDSDLFFLDIKQSLQNS